MNDNERIAREILGRQDYYFYDFNPGVPVWLDESKLPIPFNPSKNLDDCHRMEEKIKEEGRDFESYYGEILGKIVDPEGEYYCRYDPFKVAHATPQQRISAAIQMLNSGLWKTPSSQNS